MKDINLKHLQLQLLLVYLNNNVFIKMWFDDLGEKEQEMKLKQISTLQRKQALRDCD